MGAAPKLRTEGAKVVVAARRKALLDEIVSEVEASGGSALAIETEVNDPAQVSALAAAAVA